MRCNIGYIKKQHTTIFDSSFNFANQLAKHSAGQCSSNLASQLTICIALVSGHLISPFSYYMYSAGQWSSNFVDQLTRPICTALVSGHLISPVSLIYVWPWSMVI